MKRIIKLKLLPALLIVAAILISAQGCKKKTDVLVSGSKASELWLRGSVINEVTNTGIANARVYIQGQDVITTDANGIYQVDAKNLPEGTWDVRAIIDGFSYGFAEARVGYNDAVVDIILLKPLSTPVAVGTEGKTITVADPESFSSGGNTTVTVPAGAFSQTVNISVTRFFGNEVPGYAPANSLNLGTVNLSPGGTTAAVPIQLSFPLPLSGISVDNLPLLIYNEVTNAWSATGINATVNHTSNIATAAITTFGTYSLAIAGNFTETDGPVTTVVNSALDPAQSFVELNYQATNDYPGGSPSTISLVYLMNVASQNTKLHGIRNSFSDLTFTILNYIGYKPDSVVAGTSRYIWTPQLSSNWETIPMTATVDGNTATGNIRKELNLPSSYWSYVHDQGGGGK